MDLQPRTAESGSHADAIVIGAGFYGCSVAIYLAERRHLRNVWLVEREAALLSRASYNNQARVHNGYHYPRSFTTAYRSRLNLPQFVQDWPAAITRDFQKIYAIARRNSKVTARQFTRFCTSIGARVEPADPAVRQLFSDRLIEDVFIAEEFAFDSNKLAAQAGDDLKQAGVRLLLQTAATAISHENAGGLALELRNADGCAETVGCRYVFNCTYSGLNQLNGAMRTQTKLKHEITEMALLRVPPPLAGVGVTVMDGPFFSMMPFPARGLHTLSHVRYTPHASWSDAPEIDPYRRLADYEKHSRADRMMRDACRYLPAVADATHVDSLFEVKTILVKNEGDDGRPILFETHPDLPGAYSVLGGKIDNIYDVLEKLDSEEITA
ncbi:MAG: FAD-dependent oxidoreductase [Burkholderiaceae bacterium]